MAAPQLSRLMAVAALTLVVGSAAAPFQGLPTTLGAEPPKADGPPSQRREVIQFLKTHVIGKTLTTDPITYQLEGGKLEGTYSDETTFTELVETADGFRFDMTAVSKEILFELDKQGKRILPGRDYSGINVFRYELAERKSTGKLVGYWRLVSTTVKDSPLAAVVMGVQIELRKKELIWQEVQVLYQDFAAAKGRYRPGATDGKGRLFLADGKLQFELEVTAFHVDPQSLKRTPSQDKIPKFISKQVDKKKP